jgi:hypothetical protein
VIPGSGLVIFMIFNLVKALFLLIFKFLPVMFEDLSDEAEAVDRKEVLEIRKFCGLFIFL